MPRRPNPRRRASPSGHICRLRPNLFSMESPDRGGMGRLFLLLLLFHGVLIAAVVLFNCIESRPVPQRGGGEGDTVWVFIAGAFIVIILEAGRRRALLRSREAKLRQLRMRAMLNAAPERPLVSG